MENPKDVNVLNSWKLRSKEEMIKAADDFHAHLDICEQCRDHPFSLCEIGGKLLRKVGE